jgi:hypothetical protein
MCRLRATDLLDAGQVDDLLVNCQEVASLPCQPPAAATSVALTVRTPKPSTRQASAAGFYETNVSFALRPPTASALAPRTSIEDP